MGKYFSDKSDWTFGMELEMSCSVKAGGTYTFLTIQDEKKAKVIEVSGDMGTSNERRVEIATSPIRIADEQRHWDNMHLIGALKELFMSISNTDKHTMDKQGIEELFQALVDSKVSGKYQCVMNGGSLTIKEISPSVTVKGEQISFGVPIKDVDYFLQSIRAPWYETGKYSIGRLKESEWKCNYSLCVIKKFIELWKEKKDILSPIMKNKWGIMPRNPITELWDGKLEQAITLEDVLSLFEKEYCAEACREAYKYLCCGNAVGGHEKNIVRFDDQLVFECRSIPSELREFYFEYR